VLGVWPVEEPSMPETREETTLVELV
jgi:hypothetical protein